MQLDIRLKDTADDLPGVRTSSDADVAGLLSCAAQRSEAIPAGRHRAAEPWMVAVLDEGCREARFVLPHPSDGTRSFG
jgi:hypothetical protein